MAQIQQRPQSGFPFVRGDNICFSLTANPNRLGQLCVIQSQYVRRMVCQPVEKVWLINQPVLDYLCQAGFDLSFRQSHQHLSINQDASGLIKRPDHVFTERVVHPGLTTNR